MSEPNDPVKTLDQLLDLGVSLGKALHTILGRSLAEWARSTGRFSQQDVSMCVNNYEGRVYDEIREALAEEIPCTRGELDRLIRRQVATRNVDE